MNYFIGISAIIFIWGTMLIVQGVKSTTGNHKDEDLEDKQETEKKRMPAWITGGLIGLVIAIFQIVLLHLNTSDYFNFLKNKSIKLLIPDNEIPLIQLNAIELNALNCVVYFIIGAFIAVIFKSMKSQKKIQGSKGVRRLGFTLSIFPLTNVAIILYAQTKSIMPETFESYFLLPNFASKICSFISHYKPDIPIGYFAALADNFPYILETILFFVIIIGILSLSKLGYYLLMLMASSMIVYVIYFFVNFPGLYLYATIKNGSMLCYFTLLIVFFTHPNVREQFDGKIQKNVTVVT